MRFYPIAIKSRLKLRSVYALTRRLVLIFSCFKSHIIVSSQNIAERNDLLEVFGFKQFSIALKLFGEFCILDFFQNICRYIMELSFGAFADRSFYKVICDDWTSFEKLQFQTEFFLDSNRSYRWKYPLLILVAPATCKFITLGNLCRRVCYLFVLIYLNYYFIQQILLGYLFRFL